MGEIKDNFLNGIAKSNVDDSLREVPEALKPVIKLRLEEMAKIDKKNERFAAYTKFASDFTGKISDTAIATMRKVILPLLCLCLLSGPVMAEIVDGFDTSMPEIIEVPVAASSTIGFLDLKHLTDELKFGVGYNQHSDRIWGFYFPIVTKVGPVSKAEYFYLNIGAAGNWETKEGDFMASTSLNVNSCLAWVGNRAWPKKHLKFAIFPPIEISVLGAWSPSFGFYYGGLIAYKLGGK